MVGFIYYITRRWVEAIFLEISLGSANPGKEQPRPSNLLSRGNSLGLFIWKCIDV
jgi:hypothetical protein